MEKIFDAVLKYIRETNKLMWLFCLTASTLGSALVYSATRNVGTKELNMQIIAISLGVVAAIVISKIDYHFISNMWPVIAVVGGGLMLATSIWGITVPGTDDTGWLMIGGFSIQPSEFVKIAFIVTFATHLSTLIKKNKLKHFGHVMLLVCHMGVPVGVIHLQGDDGAAICFIAMFLFMTFVAGVQLRYYAATVVAAVVAVPILWNKVLNSDQKNRIEILFDHSIDSMGIGFQQEQGQISIGSGQFYGRGLFNGYRVSTGIVPEDHNDFIYSVVGEELGFIGCVLVIAIILAIVFRALFLANKSVDPLGKLICWGFLSMISFQAMANIGMCLYILPVVGITLPFFSAGGTSAVALYCGVGLVQSVAMHSRPLGKKDLSFD